MATDYQARKSAKAFRKTNKKNAEGGVKRIRKKKTARRLCRGACYQVPTLTTEDLHDAEIPSQVDPSIVFNEKADGLTKAAQTKATSSKRGSKLANDDKEAKKPKLSTDVNILRPSTPARKPSSSKSSSLQPPNDDVDNDKKHNNNTTILSSSLPELFTSFMSSKGFQGATDVQQQCWPALLQGSDIECVAEPGSGKTLSYALPAMQLLVKEGHGQDTKPQGPLVVVLLPTRELAQQVAKVFHSISRLADKCRIVCLTGGSDKLKQVVQLQLRPHVVVATPGRLIDLIEDKQLTLGHAKFVVLDEADKMLSMGFAPQIVQIKNLLFPSDEDQQQQQAALDTKKKNKNTATPALKKTPQVALLTATLPKDVRKVVSSWLTTPVKIHLTGDESDDLSISKTVTQVVHVCAEHKKPVKLLKHLAALKEASKGSRLQPRILIFANRIKTVRFVYNQVNGAGYRCAQLHGERSQEERETAVKDFKSGKIQILVASDVASRGLHITNLPYVVNYDFPGNLETYVHRVGRTGRLSADGHAYSFLTRELAAVAQPLIDLLQQHGQAIDPNLVKLANAYAIAAKKLGLAVAVPSKQPLKEKETSDAEDGSIENSDEDEEEKEVVEKPRINDILHELGMKSKAHKKKKNKKASDAQPKSDNSDIEEDDDEEDVPPRIKTTAAIAKKKQKTDKVQKTDIKPKEAAEFIASKKFAGAKPGYVFKKGYAGVGYYNDVNIYALWKKQQQGKTQQQLSTKAKLAALPIGGGGGGVARDDEDIKASTAAGKNNRASHKKLPGRLRKKLAKQAAGK